MLCGSDYVCNKVSLQREKLFSFLLMTLNITYLWSDQQLSKNTILLKNIK